MLDERVCTGFAAHLFVPISAARLAEGQPGPVWEWDLCCLRCGMDDAYIRSPEPPPGALSEDELLAIRLLEKMARQLRR